VESMQIKILNTIRNHTNRTGDKPIEITVSRADFLKLIRECFEVETGITDAEILSWKYAEYDGVKIVWNYVDICGDLIEWIYPVVTK
jgi:hypothetical protein